MVMNKDKIVSVSEVLSKYPSRCCTSKVKTLAVKVAREAIFGDDVLIKCTVARERELPGLPVYELAQLKQAMFNLFPQF